MRTGWSGGATPDEEAGDMQMTAKILASMRVVLEEMVYKSALLATVEGVNEVNHEHVVDAMKYVARTFLEIENLQERITTNYQDEVLGTADSLVSMLVSSEESGESDSGEDLSDSDSEGSALGGSNGGSSNVEVTGEDRERARRIKEVAAGWDEWAPQDPLEVMLRSATQKYIDQVGNAQSHG